MRFQLQSIGWLLVAMTVGLCQSSACAGEPFDYFRNSWNVIGLKDYNDGTRITPDNELLLAGGDKAQMRFGKDTDPPEPRTNQDALRGLDADHSALGERRRGALRFHILGNAVADGQGLAQGLRLAHRRGELPQLDHRQSHQHWRRPGRSEIRHRRKRQVASGAHSQSWSLAPGESAEGCVRHSLRRRPGGDSAGARRTPSSGSIGPSNTGKA